MCHSTHARGEGQVSCWSCGGGGAKESGARLPELETEAWEEAEIRLTDLWEGESVYVPLAHVLGTSKYFGRVLMPGGKVARPDAERGVYGSAGNGTGGPAD